MLAHRTRRYYKKLKMLNILVLGSEGFVGSHLVTHFSLCGYNVFGCDILEQSRGIIDKNYFKYKNIGTISKIFKSQKIDTCINASGSGNVSLSINNPAFDFKKNTSDVFDILEAIRTHKPDCTYLHISSAAVYGEPKIFPIDENATLNPLSPYGWHKFAAELICKEFSQVYGLKTIIIRPFSVYGTQLKKQLLWDLYQKYILNNNEIVLYGTGNETRDFIFIEDMVGVVELIVRKANTNAEIFNIASGEANTIKKVAELFLSHIDKNTKIKFNSIERKGDPEFWKADISKIINLGFTPKTNLEQGLKIVSEWIKNQN